MLLLIAVAGTMITTGETSLENYIHDFQAISKYKIRVLPCKNFKDPNLYKLIDFDFAKTPPKAGEKNIIRTQYKILQNIEIESVWGQLYFQGPFGIWIKAWKGTKKFTPKFQLKKSDKVKHSSTEIPLDRAFSGNYKGKAKIFGNGNQEIGCFDFRMTL